jgi:hypothetical protein
MPCHMQGPLALQSTGGLYLSACAWVGYDTSGTYPEKVSHKPLGVLIVFHIGRVVHQCKYAVSALQVVS